MVEFANMFVDGEDEVAVPKRLVELAEVEAPNKLPVGAPDVAEAKMLFEGAAEEVAPKALPEGAGELVANALFVEPELPTNAFGCALDDAPNKLKVGADDVLLLPNTLLVGADDDAPKTLLDGVLED